MPLRTAATGRPSREVGSVARLLTTTPRPAEFTPMSPSWPAIVTTHTVRSDLRSRSSRTVCEPSCSVGRSIVWPSTAAGGQASEINGVGWARDRKIATTVHPGLLGTGRRDQVHSSSINESAATSSGSAQAPSAIPRSSSNNSGVCRLIAARCPVAFIKEEADSPRASRPDAILLRAPCMTGRSAVP